MDAPFIELDDQNFSVFDDSGIGANSNIGWVLHCGQLSDEPLCCKGRECLPRGGGQRDAWSLERQKGELAAPIVRDRSITRTKCQERTFSRPPPRRPNQRKLSARRRGLDPAVTVERAIRFTRSRAMVRKERKLSPPDTKSVLKSLIFHIG